MGAKAKLNYGPADFFVSVDKTLGGSDGLLGKVGVEITQPITEQFVLGAQASATFADKNYMTAYFGIDGEQTVRSGYKSYKAGAGLKNIDLSVSAANRNWVLSSAMPQAAPSSNNSSNRQPFSSSVTGSKIGSNWPHRIYQVPQLNSRDITGLSAPVAVRWTKPVVLHPRD